MAKQTPERTSKEHLAGPRARSKWSPVLTAVVATALLLCLLGSAVYQHRELVSLKQRLATLEMTSQPAQEHRAKRQAEDLTSQSRDVRQSLDGNLLALITNLVETQTELLTRYYCVNASKICERGQSGPTGPAGQKGEPGLRGDPGPSSVGPQGPEGPHGPPGPPGPTGASGQKGEAGLPGVPGEKGSEGERGNSGSPGVTSPGTPPWGGGVVTGAVPGERACYLGGGRRARTRCATSDSSTIGCRSAGGPKGEAGDTGIQGPVGPQGQRGEPGPKGDMGLVGSPGMTGPMGPSGPPGPKGDSGYASMVIPPMAESALCCARLEPPIPSTATAAHVTAVSGSDVLIACNTTGYPPPTVTWSPPLPASPRYSVTPGGLHISGVTAADESTYTCHVSNIFGSNQQSTELKVKEPVRVAVAALANVVTQHDSVVFTCSFSGHPAPDVTWSHLRLDGTTEALMSTPGHVIAINQAADGSGTSTLTVLDAGALDGGEYICTAVNPYDSVSSRAPVTVNSVPYLSRLPQNHTVTVGGAIRLFCTVMGNPPPTVEWFYPMGGQPFNSHELGDHSLLITNADKYNEGTYTCQVSNQYGTVNASATVTVDVPVTAVVTPNVTSVASGYVALSCVGGGNPTPTVSWSRLVTPMPNDPGRFIVLPAVGDLVIAGVSAATAAQDSGVYVCAATNGASTATDYAVVYKDLGTVDCAATFADCTQLRGAACGAMCPGNCHSPGTASVLKGFIHYTMDSSVCLAGLQSGVIVGQGGRVLWQVQDGTGVTLAAGSQHGVTSTADGQQPVVAVILDPNVANPVL